MSERTLGSMGRPAREDCGDGALNFSVLRINSDKTTAGPVSARTTLATIVALGAALLVGGGCGDDAAPEPSSPAPAWPRLKVLAPANGSTVQGATAELHFRAELAAATGYAIRVGEAEPMSVVRALAAGEEVKAELALAVGLNVIRIALMDAAGEADVAELVLERTELPAPEVSITAPTAGQRVDAEQLELRGRVRAWAELVEVVWSDGTRSEGLEVDGEGYFARVLDVAVGPQVWTVRAEDSSGRVGEAEVSFERGADTTAPELSLEFPAPGHGVSTRVVAVVGRVHDGDAVARVWLEGANPPVEAEILDGRFVAKLALQPGLNRFSVHAEDISGNASEVAGTVYFGQRVGAGGAHGGVILDGALYTWGRNNLGQTGLGFQSGLGDEAHPTEATLVRTSSAATFVSLAFAQNGSVALDDAGHVWSFGDGDDGQLCLGSGAPSVDETDWSEPVRVEGLEGVVAIHRGYDHSLMLLADGTVLGCGDNQYGQLGDGTTEDRDVPTAVAGLQDIVQILGGSKNTFALGADGRVWVAGRNRYGNLGQGSADDEAHPSAAPVPGLADVVQIAGGRDHVLALTSDGSLYAWGLNSAQQVGPTGIGGFEDDVLSPVSLEWADDVVAVHAGGNQAFAENAAGQLFGWGQAINGNLGIPVDENLPEPTNPVFGIERARHVAIGPLQGFAETEDGTLFAWGWSFQGSLGGGESTIDRWGYRIPILVQYAAP